MILKLEDYRGGWRFASIANSKESADRIVANGRTALLLQDKTVRLLPDNIAFALTTEEESLHDYDVVEIKDSGFCSRKYQANSNDNAIVVTSLCNSNCLMCPSPRAARDNGLISKIEDLCALIEYIPPDAPHLTITGGEPTLLRDDFFTLMACLNQNLPQTNLLYLTNARAFSNKNYAKRFCSLSTDLTRIAIPLHASSHELHDAIACAKESFNQTVAALVNIASSKAEIEVRVVVSKLNLSDLDNVADFLIQKIPRITCVNYIALEMSGSAALHQEEIWLDYKEAFGKIKEGILKLVKNEIDVNLYNFPLCAVEKGFWGISRQSISDYKVRYASECADCQVQEICGGQFASTLAGGYFSVSPIKGQL
jgi:His-Xaa-Ser system radical SAM maturase HxsC